jgi:hypothetical protein
VGLGLDLEAAGWEMPESSERWEAASGTARLRTDTDRSGRALAYRCDEPAGCAWAGDRVARGHAVFIIEAGPGEELQVGGSLSEGRVSGLCGLWRGVGTPEVGLGELALGGAPWSPEPEECPLPRGDCDADGSCESDLLAGGGSCGVCGVECPSCAVGRCVGGRARDGVLSGAMDLMCGVFEAEAWCWAAGDGSAPRRAAARAVAVASLRSAGGAAVCVLDPDGDVTCELPGGERVSPLSGAVEIAAGSGAVCGLDAAGAVRCSSLVGLGGYTPLSGGAVDLLGSADGDLGFRVAGGRIANIDPGLHDIQWRVGDRYAAGCLGGAADAGIDAEGRLEILGDPYAQPPERTSVADAVQVDASWDELCVLRADGTVGCLRDDLVVPIDGLVGVEAIGAGARVMCAKTGARAARCFSADGAVDYAFEAPRSAP